MWKPTNLYINDDNNDDGYDDDNDDDDDKHLQCMCTIPVWNCNLLQLAYRTRVIFRLHACLR